MKALALLLVFAGGCVATAPSRPLMVYSHVLPYAAEIHNRGRNEAEAFERAHELEVWQARQAAGYPVRRDGD